jgi:antitoxin component of RelBE/YafQ-DinJ toxin-antitoxin module
VAAALKKVGLTVSDAFRLLLVRVAAEKALLFEPFNPVISPERGSDILSNDLEETIRCRNYRSSRV